MLDQVRARPLVRHKLILMVTVMAALLLALVLSFAPIRNASADGPPPFFLVNTIPGFTLAINLAVAPNDDIRVIDIDAFGGSTADLKAFDKDGTLLSTTPNILEARGSRYVPTARVSYPSCLQSRLVSPTVGNQQKWDTFVKERSGGNGSVVGLPEQVVVAFATG